MARKLLSLKLILLIPLLASGCREKAEWQRTTLFAFDSACEVEVFGTASEFEAAQKRIIDTFQELQDRFSPDAEDLSSPLVVGLFRKAQEVYEASGGAFDITVKPLSRLWGFQHDSRYVPTSGQVAEALERVGMDKVGVGPDRIILPPGMGLDWGGVAKGLAVDLAVKELKAMGIGRGFVNAGGDLYCWGKNPENFPWKVGVRHPRREGYLGILALSDLGAATSGDYQRYFESGGVRYHHIFDPKIGFPARGKQSVTIVGPETATCDALATAVFVSPDPVKILDKYPRYGAIIVDDAGRILFAGKKIDFLPEK